MDNEKLNSPGAKTVGASAGLLLIAGAAAIELGSRSPMALSQGLPESSLHEGVVSIFGLARAIPGMLAVGLPAPLAALALGLARYPLEPSLPTRSTQVLAFAGSILLRLSAHFVRETGASQLLLGFSWTALALVLLSPGDIRRILQSAGVEVSALAGSSIILVAGFTLRHPIRIGAMQATAHAVDLILRALPGNHSFAWEGIYPSITFDSFNASIGAGCAGLHSASAFTALVGLIWLLEGARWQLKRLPLVYLAGVVVFFVENTLRIAALFVIGARYSEEFALGIFHSTAGWMLFVITFGAFMWTVMKTDAVRPDPAQPAASS